ncbi:MAG TPA: SDR family NAD(P)-dependent oxidoreductase, partial [Acidimicrobiales bacterium]|nr:SDR family NAD(P)-dependent oxidoreductase [Acidimicrobiales bacterium]
MNLARVVDAALEASVVGSFTRVGDGVRRRVEHWGPPARLDGRVALVTGATSGLGLAYARGLAALGASTHLLGRDRARTEATRAAL